MKRLPLSSAARHKNSAVHGCCFTHIQRRKAPPPSLFFPLYKQCNRRYNKNRSVPKIRLYMEGWLRMQEAGVGSACFCIALFMPYR